MSRLPIPGSDDGSWGTILNDFLSVELNGNGTLKSSGTLASYALDSTVLHNTGNENVGGIKTFSASPIVPTPTLGSQAANKTYVDSMGGASDATTTTNGIVRLAGDLGGAGTTAAAPVITNGAITDAKVSNTAAIAKSKLASLSIVDADVSAISEGKITGLTADLAAKIPAAIVDAKGDVIVATAADTVARLPVGSDGQMIVANSGQSTGVAWTDRVREVYPFSAYGFHSASESTGAFTATSNLNQAFWTRIFVPAGKSITAVGSMVWPNTGTLGAGGLNGFAIYTDSGTLVSSSVSDDTMWTTIGWVIKTLQTVVPASNVDRFVYGAASVQGYSSDPSIVYARVADPFSIGGGYLVNNRRSFFNPQSSWPASINPTTHGGDGLGYIPLIALG